MTAVLSGLAAGLLAGALSGAFGIGGGIVLVPLLALGVGLGQHEAQGVTLAVLLLPLGLPAVFAYHRDHPIPWRLAAALALGFGGCVPLGAVAANWLPERPLRLLFVFFLLAAAWQAWQGTGGSPRERARPSSPWHGLWIGAGGGLVSGLLGIGGGIVMVPLLVAVLGLSQMEAQGTALAAMLPPIGLPGVLVYARTERGLPWLLLAGVATGFAGGAFGGARLARRFAGAPLARAFSLFVLAVAAALVVSLLRG